MDLSLSGFWLVSLNDGMGSQSFHTCQIGQLAVKLAKSVLVMGDRDHLTVAFYS